MASKEEFVSYVAEQFSGAGVITYRKMFGEYGMYCDGKLFAVICNDQVFVKITEAGRVLAPDLEEASPYHNAKPHFLLEDVDDKAFLSNFAKATCEELPMPKPKRPKKETGRRTT